MVTGGSHASDARDDGLALREAHPEGARITEMANDPTQSAGSRADAKIWHAAHEGQHIVPLSEWPWALTARTIALKIRLDTTTMMLRIEYVGDPTAYCTYGYHLTTCSSVPDWWASEKASHWSEVSAEVVLDDWAAYRSLLSDDRISRVMWCANCLATPGEVCSIPSLHALRACACYIP